MEAVTLKPLLHRNKECIGIYYLKNTLLDNIVRSLPAVRWSKTHACWHIPLTENSYQLLSTNLEGKAILDNSLLKTYLLKKRKIKATLPEPGPVETTNKPGMTTASSNLIVDDILNILAF